jgi:5-methylcytosine-specific restriction enzyme subunit McrC
MESREAFDDVSSSNFRVVDGRSVFSGLEYTEISVPLELLLVKEKVVVYDEVRDRGLFQIQIGKSSLVLRAGGFVGYIPLNDLVGIEVQPRIPIYNLEYMLLSCEDYSPLFLDKYDRYFDVGATPTPSVLDMLCLRLLDHISDISYQGIHFEYEEQELQSHYPAGRIHPYSSAQSQIRSGDPFKTVSSRFVRIIDNPANRCLKMAVHRLLSIYRSRQRKGTIRWISRLLQANQIFDSVSLDYQMEFLDSPMINDPSFAPEHR